MTIWIVLAAVAQLINAGIVFVDKYVLVHKPHIGRPVAYAFYVSILSGFVAVVVPFGVISWPTGMVLFYSLLSSATFIVSILLLYTALKEGHASDIMPVVGAISAIATALCAYQWLTHDLPRSFVFSLVCMIIGMLLISHFHLTKKQHVYVILSGILFGITAFVTKLVFLEADFIDGFFWTRMGNVVGGLALLTIPANRKAIFAGYHGSSHGTKWLVIANKTLSGIAVALTLLAISLGSVSVVNAMSGLQFVFLLVFAYLFSGWFPNVLRGEIARKGLAHKLVGIGFIVLGLALLFILQ